jgi:hypothetical protein
MTLKKTLTYNMTLRKSQEFDKMKQSQECIKMKQSQECDTNMTWKIWTPQMKMAITNNGNISVENESQEDSYITIFDLNMVKQMNTAHINTDPETREELPKTDLPMTIPTNHMYNLKPQPTERNKRLIMTQAQQQSTENKIAKPHAHIMIMQMNVRQGI